MTTHIIPAKKKNATVCGFRNRNIYIGNRHEFRYNLDRRFCWMELFYLTNGDIKIVAKLRVAA